MQILINDSQRGVQTAYPLQEDVLAGFHSAVRNNQVTLAMEYLRFIVDELLVRVSEPAAQPDSAELENRIAVLEQTIEELKGSLAQSRKVIKKPAAQDAAEPVE